jgi:CubicO group peptidase (beta-lactamase class C family)
LPSACNADAFLPTDKELTLLHLPFAALAQTIPSGPAVDAEVKKIMTETHANGMAIAVIDHGKVGYVHAYGIRNAKGDPLTTDTVMYGPAKSSIRASAECASQDE